MPAAVRGRDARRVVVLVVIEEFVVRELKLLRFRQLRVALVLIHCHLPDQETHLVQRKTLPDQDTQKASLKTLPDQATHLVQRKTLPDEEGQTVERGPCLIRNTVC